MRWFKHFSDNHRGQSVQFLLDELGYFGPFFYYLIYELCAEKFEFQLVSGATPEVPEFNFHQRVVCSASRAKLSTVVRALDAGQSCGLWTWNLNGVQVEIKLPILLNLLDRDMKKPRLRRATNAQNTRPEEEEDTDSDKDIEVEASSTPNTFREKINSVQNFEAQFDPEVVQLKQDFRKPFGKRLDYLIPQIVDHWGGAQNFHRWAFDVSQEYKRKKDVNISEERWLECTIRRVLGVDK